MNSEIYGVGGEMIPLGGPGRSFAGSVGTGFVTSDAKKVLNITPTRSYGSVSKFRREQLVTHKVEKEDTLQGLALKYNVSTEQIRRANHMFANDSIFLREQLLIPVDNLMIAANSNSFNTDLDLIPVKEGENENLPNSTLSPQLTKSLLSGSCGSLNSIDEDLNEINLTDPSSQQSNVKQKRAHHETSDADETTTDDDTICNPFNSRKTALPSIRSRQSSEKVDDEFDEFLNFSKSRLQKSATVPGSLSLQKNNPTNRGKAPLKPVSAQEVKLSPEPISKDYSDFSDHKDFLAKFDIGINKAKSNVSRIKENSSISEFSDDHDNFFRDGASTSFVSFHKHSTNSKGYTDLKDSPELVIRSHSSSMSSSASASNLPIKTTKLVKNLSANKLYQNDLFEL